MDPLFDLPSLGTSRQFNVMTDEERKALLTMSAMDKTGWAPESFRDGPWGIADDPQHPWRHKDVPGFLGKLGYGTVHRMPEIIDERRARALGKLWRDEVWGAFLPLNENIRRDGDLIIYILANEQVLPDHEISTLLSNAWENTKRMPLYAPLFGQTSVTEDAPEGYRDYLSHWRGTVRHDCKAEADPSSNSQKADKASWTRPLLDVKIKEPQIFNDFVARNMLALTIPWLHTKHLLNRHTLWRVIMDRCTAQPYDLSRIDWIASHLARSTHLAVPPYRDGWFMGFPNLEIGNKYWTSLEQISTQTIPTDARVHWHGLNIIDPGPKELRDPRFVALRDSGLVYPWGEGLLLLQCQGAISRFMENLVPSLLERLALSNEWPKKMLKPLMSIDPYANEAEEASVIEPGLFGPDTQKRMMSLIMLDNVHLRRFATKRLGWLTWDDPDYRPVGASPTSRAAAFRDYSLSLYRALAELRHNPIVFRKFFAAVMEAHPGGVPENVAAAASWEAKRDRKLREKARKKRGGAGAGNAGTAAVARVSPEAPAGGELAKVDAAEDGDRVDFASATAKDCLESDKEVNFLADPLPGPKSRVSWDSLLAHLRRFAEILKTLLVDDGLLHSSPWIRQNFQRETCNGEWESRAAVGMSHMTPWALPTTFLPFEHRFARNIGALQRDEQALVDDLQLLNHGDGEAAGFIGMWRVIHEMANNVGDMSERGYFESQNTRGLANTLHHRWIMERYGGAGRYTPGRFRPSTSQSHQEHEIYRARVRTRLTQTDWLTVERTFGHDTGGITWHDWCKLVTHMGFQMQPMGGSIFKFTYTSASMLLNGQGQAGWRDHTTLHMQHGSGNTTLRPQVARSYATRFYASFGVTRDTIAEAYSTHADPDPEPDAEEDVDESDGERKRNRKRKRQKERFDRWLKAQPPVGHGGNGPPARQLEIPMVMLDADIEDGPDDEDGGEEEATGLAALDINARMARMHAAREGGYLSRTEQGREGEEDYDETVDEELAESDEVDGSPQENVEEKYEDEETDEEERPRKRTAKKTVFLTPLSSRLYTLDVARGRFGGGGRSPICDSGETGRSHSIGCFSRGRLAMGCWRLGARLKTVQKSREAADRMMMARAPKATAMTLALWTSIAWLSSCLVPGHDRIPVLTPRGRIVLYKCPNAADQGVSMRSDFPGQGQAFDELELLTFNATLFSLSEKGGSTRSTGCAVRGVHGSGVSGMPSVASPWLNMGIGNEF
ncbi:predicted protein [Verticillium alfalfae VaMs.102]|uniref:Predicted protein n=1 Tax=Verticillium alfalfae (strain VaMs.102 / ATCC MYA-4576 / FGSC 10136) TaxID=526221 RepID=C9SUG1_VERA1|nr:predicted protein [Verticillium alfalfae VaMs.102]EEY22472.1 predicted protein [Verticillium alfalfae VaMs.102]